MGFESFGSGENNPNPPKKFNLGGLIEKIRTRLNSVAIENLDPDDKLIKLIPGILPEHLARYNFVSKFLEKRGINKPLTVLDAASGRGYGSNMLKETLPVGTKVVGVELQFPYVQKAVNKYSPGNTGSPYFVQADVKHLPVADNSIDAVTAFEITEHLSKEDQLQFIQEIGRVLNQGGVGFISVPYPYSLVVNSEGELVKDISSNPHHLYEPTRDEMVSMIQKSGLTIKEELGQSLLNKNQADKLRKISSTIPIWPLYLWVVPRDFSVKQMPKDPNIITATQIFVVEKPR